MTGRITPKVRKRALGLGSAGVLLAIAGTPVPGAFGQDQGPSDEPPVPADGLERFSEDVVSESDAEIDPMIRAQIDALFASEIQDPEMRAAFVQQDIDYRMEIGFRSDRSYVDGLYDDPASTFGNRSLGALFTAEEVDELDLRLELENRAKAAAADLIKVAPGSFGGMYMDQPAGGRIVMQLVAATQDESGRNADAEDLISGHFEQRSDRLDFQYVRYSYSELQAATVTGRSYVGEVGRLDDVVLVWLDVRNNAVEIDFNDARVSPAELDQLVTAVKAAAGEDAGTFRFGRHAGMAESSLRDDPGTPPFAGGHGYKRAKDSKRCTMAFQVNRTGEPSGAGYSLSADHCMADLPYTGPDSKFRHGYNSNDKLFGQVYDHMPLNGSGTDFGVIKMVNSGTVTPKVLLGSGGAYAHTKGTEGQPLVGSSRCRTGARSDEFSESYLCGVVQSNNAGGAGWDPIVNLQDWVKVKTRHGDSGGPLMQVYSCSGSTSGTCVKATGVLSGNACVDGTPGVDCTITASNDSFYASVFYLAHNWNIVTN